MVLFWETPFLENERQQEKYAIANKYRNNYNFNEAEVLFYELLADSVDNIYVLWELLLCKYGVVFLEDEESGEMVPSIIKNYENTILEDRLYKKLIKKEDPIKDSIIILAERIDAEQRKISSVIQKELPYDVFISYKESDFLGHRTNDSVKAYEIYEKLTKKGYRVFFSRVSLENVIGSEYEPYIYAALMSARIMLQITSSKEYSQSSWVKNEWNRYSILIKEGHEKTLIPVVFDMEKTDLPEELLNYAAYSLDDIDFEQELFRGIARIIPTPINKIRKDKRKRILIATISIVFTVIALVGVFNYSKVIKKRNDQRAEYQKAIDYSNSGQHLDAVKKMEEIPEYDDAIESAEKIKQRWRKSLANVITSSGCGSFWNGTYYINANGGVSSFPTDPGELADYLTVNEHGKVVSIENNYIDQPILAIREDGYVDLLKIENVIKIKRLTEEIVVWLSDDGTMDYSCIYDLDTYENTWDVIRHVDDEYYDAWVTQILDLTDINQFEISSMDENTASSTSIIALDNQGNLHLFVSDSSKMYFDDCDYKFQDFVASLHDVKRIKKYNYGINCPNLIVEFNDGKKVSWDNGEVSWLDVNEQTIGVYDDVNKTIVIDGQTLLSDVVYATDNYAVTRTGNIYRIMYDSVESRDLITVVYDEWEQ